MAYRNEFCLSFFIKVLGEAGCEGEEQFADILQQVGSIYIYDGPDVMLFIGIHN